MLNNTLRSITGSTPVKVSLSVVFMAAVIVGSWVLGHISSSIELNSKKITVNQEKEDTRFTETQNHIIKQQQTTDKILIEMKHAREKVDYHIRDDKITNRASVREAME